MKILSINIHNFRSIEDAVLYLGDYSLLIGANNSGKSNLVDALRIFYEKEIKFEFDRDFPKFSTEDKESWVEIEYKLSREEALTIKQEYLTGSNSFTVRRWLYPSEKTKLGYFGYENGKLTDTLFYGWKNVGQAKLGNVVYIPAISRLEDHTKLTGPSALRDLVNDILKPIIKSSAAFSNLTNQFKEFGTAIKEEETPDKRSLKGLESRINEEIKGWGASFNIDVTTPQEDDIVKGLIRHSVTDIELNKALESGSFGHGFQRHLIFSLVRIAASYTAPKAEAKKKEFSPELELLLFEEPEAFLHPPQQDELDTSLRQLAVQPDRQVLAATHSPHFVSYNTDDIADLVHFQKVGARTKISQISRERLKEIFEDNQVICRVYEAAQSDPSLEFELEEIRHFLWLNPERCGMFFAGRVLIVEGLTEQVVTNYLFKTGQIELKAGDKGVFALDARGKYNIHRFMNLLGELEIEHAVLHDLDSDKVGNEKTKHEGLNDLIAKSKNEYTVSIDTFPRNLESFLGVPVVDNDHWRKAAKALLSVKRGEVPADKLKAFIEKIKNLLS